MQKLFVFAIWLTSVLALRIEDVEEGRCTRKGFYPASNGDWSFVNNLIYIPAGSRHDLYAIASSHPRFRQMRENELVDNMCLTHNATLPLGRGSPIGFGGRALGTYYFGPRIGQSGVFDLALVAAGNGVGAALQRGTETITLTDYKTFAFFANCFSVNGSEQKSWKLVSITPNLSVKTRRMIEKHAVSLGFNRKNFLFLNYDNCGVDVSRNDGGLRTSGLRNWRRTGAEGTTGSIARSAGFRQSGWSK